MLPENGKLLRIYIDENDKHEGKPLYQWLVKKARENEMAGAAVLRGILGYGSHSVLHSAKILRMTTELPLVIEIVDKEENIEKFIPIIDRAVKEGLVTVENVKMKFYHK